MSKPLHLGIDGNEANVMSRVGSNLYAYELLKAIHALNHSAHPSPNRFTIYLKDPPLPDMPAASAAWHYRVLRPKKFWTQWRLPLDLFLGRPRPQVFFSPGHYAPRKCPIPSVVTILDLAFLEYPNLFLKYERGVAQLTQWTKYSVDQASHLIAISQNTKRSILKHYAVDANKITVAYPGIDTHRFTPQKEVDVKPVLHKYQLKPPYLLYVGTLQPRKNLNRLIEAFTSLPTKYAKLQLVLAGGEGWLLNDLKLTWQNSKAKTRIKFPGYINSDDLPALYSGAKALILVGLAEGFGIPPAEAIACGTLSVVSSTGALPEVVGPAGIQVDPFSVTSIKHGIISILELSDKQKQTRLVACQAHIKQFNWQNAAVKVMEVLNDVAL